MTKSYIFVFVDGIDELRDRVVLRGWSVGPAKFSGSAHRLLASSRFKVWRVWSNCSPEISLES